MHSCIHAVVDFLQQVTKIIREVIAAEWLVSRCRNNCFSKYIRALVHLFDQFDLNASSCSKSSRRSCRREYIGRRLCNLSAMIRFQRIRSTRLRRQRSCARVSWSRTALWLWRCVFMVTFIDASLKLLASSAWLVSCQFLIDVSGATGSPRELRACSHTSSLTFRARRALRGTLATCLQSFFFIDVPGELRACNHASSLTFWGATGSSRELRACSRTSSLTFRARRALRGSSAPAVILPH